MKVLITRLHFHIFRRKEQQPATESRSFDLPSEILISIFTRLDCLELVQKKRVCRKYLEIVEENPSLWRSLDLLKEEWNFKSPSWKPWILNLFDQKSQSSLKEVSIIVKFGQYGEVESFIKTLERSKQTLETLVIVVQAEEGFYETAKALTELSDLTWKLPNLVHCRVIDSRPTPVKLKVISTDKGPSSTELKVLWISKSVTLFHSRLHLLGNLTSLSINLDMSRTDWKRVLEVACSTLRHFKYDFGYEHPESTISNPPFSILRFPNLKLLQTSGDPPTWFEIPTSATLISKVDFVNSSPSVSRLWISRFPVEEGGLLDRCPQITELRLTVPGRFQTTRWMWELLVSTLRREKTECGSWNGN